MRGAGKRYAHIESIRGELGHRVALRRLGGYVFQLKIPLLFCFLFTFGWSSLNLGFGKLASEVLDHLPALATSRSPGLVNFYALLWLGVFAARGVLFYGMTFLWSYTSEKLTLRLRDEVFSHLQEMSVPFFDHRKTGQLMSCLTSDVQAVTSVLDAVQDSITAPVVLIGGTALLLWLSWPLALLSLLCLTPTAVIIIAATRRMKKHARKLQANRAEILDLAQEILSAIRVVKAFGNERHEVRRFRHRSHEVFRAVLRTVRVKAAWKPIVEFLGAASMILVLWLGAWQISHGYGGLTMGALVWFVMVLTQVANAARDAGSISVNLGSAGAAADRIFTLLSYQSEVVQKPGAAELERVDGRLAFEDVGFAYSAGIPVLKGISFTVNPGEVVALVGPTGAGKSTIAGLILRFYDVSSGAVTIDGIDVRDCTLDSVRAQIGVVPQETVLFAGTLRDNIAYGRLRQGRAVPDEEIVAAAQMANAWEFISRLPDGLETVVGERGVRLSGGQRQRIAIARAVLRDPRILILDEATSSLDSRSEALVQDALQKLVKDRTTLVIAHRLSTIRHADRILVLTDGEFVESGAHEELLASGGVYADLYRTQFRPDAQLVGPAE